DRKHAVTDVAALGAAEFLAELAVAIDLEEADGHPHREDVAADGDVVVDLAQQRLLQVGMVAGHGAGNIKQVATASGPGAEDGVVEATAVGILLVSRGRNAGGKRFEWPVRLAGDAQGALGA